MVETTGVKTLLRHKFKAKSIAAHSLVIKTGWLGFPEVERSAARPGGRWPVAFAVWGKGRAEGKVPGAV